MDENFKKYWWVYVGGILLMLMILFFLSMPQDINVQAVFMMLFSLLITGYYLSIKLAKVNFNIWFVRIVQILFLVPLIALLVATIPPAIGSPVLSFDKILLILLGIFIWVEFIFNLIKNRIWYFIMFVASTGAFVFYAVVGILASMSGDGKAFIGVMIGSLFSLIGSFIAITYLSRILKLNEELKTKKK